MDAWRYKYKIEDVVSNYVPVYTRVFKGYSRVHSGICLLDTSGNIAVI